jgi:hypothetical protein
MLSRAETDRDVSLFRDARLKIQRADKHLEDLDTIFLALQNSYRSRVQRDAKTGGQSIKHESTEAGDAFKDTFAIITGDCIHNLKTALDHAWNAALTRIAPSLIDKYTRFPVRDTLQELEGTLHGKKMDSICPGLHDFIVSHAKPYKAGNFDLWAIHELDIIDKHRLLLPLVQTAWIADIAVKNQAGQIMSGTTMLQLGSGPYHVDFFPGNDVQDEGNLSIEIIFEDGTPTEGLEILDTLRRFLRLVRQIVIRLEGVAA